LVDPSTSLRTLSDLKGSPYERARQHFRVCSESRHQRGTERGAPKA
jgi:hypothetical protein